MSLRVFIFGLAALTTLVASAPVAFGQLARPAAEYHSLLNIHFSEDDGEFVIEGLQMVFPPAGDEPVRLIVTRASGDVVAIVPLRFEPRSGSTIFGDLVPISKPGEFKIGESGDFVLTVSVGPREITRLPFTLKVEPLDNPYEPSKRFLREGPWRDLAYLSVPIGIPGAPVDFSWWMSLRELPTGMTNPTVTIHLIRGSVEIARSQDLVTLNNTDWASFTSELVRTTKSGPQPLTLADLVKRDDDYLLIVEADGKPIKSYRLTVERGRLQRVDQSRLDFEPHVDFISPRLIDTSARSDSRYSMRDVYWVRRSAVTATFPRRANSK